MSTERNAAKILASIATGWKGIATDTVQAWDVAYKGHAWVIRLPLGAAVDLEAMAGWTVTAARTCHQAATASAWGSQVGIN